MSYRLPASLTADLTKFATLADDYTEGRVSATEFKAFRVPMGVYEQRRDEVYMARVRATGGVISPEQLLRLIDIATTHGSNLLHLTTRQEIQIQNLQLGRVHSVLCQLQAAGLATKGGGGNTVRNIMVSEMSGIGRSETFDTTPYALELTSLMIAEPDSYLLPRKMKIAFSSDESDEDYAAINDVGLVARVDDDGRRGFRVYVGGGAGARPTTGWLLTDFLPDTQLYTLVRALKTFFSEHGNRKDRNKARIRFIFYKRGAEETLALIRRYLDEELIKDKKIVVTPPADERPAYTYVPKPEPDSEGYRQWRRRYVVPQRQEGYVSVLLPITLGNIALDDGRIDLLRRVLHFISRFGAHTLRFTNAQNIRLRNLPTESLPELYELIAPLGDEATAPAIVSHIVSCTGADTCRLGIGLSKGLAAAIRRRLIASGLDLDRVADVQIHVTGCPNSCGQQLWADLGFAGRALHNERTYPGYQVFIAARRRHDPRLAQSVGNLSARDVPVFVERLLADYLARPQAGRFADYLETEGRTVALRLIDEYKTIPSFADDKNYYFDWGAEELFTVTPRGRAECSAGLFDMINVDIDRIATARRELEQGTADTSARSRLVAEVIFAASRMLLVTRGLDPRSTAEVYDAFLTHFVEPGYVSAHYRDLIEMARDRAEADFRSRADDALALADEVISLYKEMDDSLQFKKPAAQAPAAAPATPERPDERATVRRKDLRGVLCPMNFVRTKLELATMGSGELLEIWLDDGQPIENVPGSVRLEGHTIVEQTPVDDYWRVLIRKK